MTTERILGIDPSFTPGWVVVEFDTDKQIARTIARGYENVNKSTNKYRSLYELVNNICDTYEVTHYIIEKQFFKSMYQILGSMTAGAPFHVVILNNTKLSKAAREAKVTNSVRYDHDYNQIRKIIYGTTKVDKEQTKQDLLTHPTLGVDKNWCTDETDALALVLAYLVQEHSYKVETEAVL